MEVSIKICSFSFLFNSSLIWHILSNFFAFVIFISASLLFCDIWSQPNT